MDCRPARLNGNKFIIKTGKIFSKPNFKTTKKPLNTEITKKQHISEVSKSLTPRQSRKNHCTHAPQKWEGKENHSHHSFIRLNTNIIKDYVDNIKMAEVDIIF